MSADADIAIIGYGPGGQALASLLGQAGHDVVVLEKAPVPYTLPRMSTLDGEIARLLQHASSDIRKALKDSLPQKTMNVYGADEEVSIAGDVDKTVCGHPARISLHQPNIEAAMQERVDSIPSVRVQWNSRVSFIEDAGELVRLRVENGTTGESEELTARYAVGMDGASSFVREALGFGLEVLHKHDDSWVLTDFDILDEAVPAPTTAIYMLPKGPYYYGPNGARRCRIDVKVLNDARIEDVFNHDHALDFLEKIAGVSRDQVRISRQVLYHFRSHLAESFRKGRVFLGGDAAHAMTPFMAQGSCSALRDSINLAWKLDYVLTGRAEDSLLDTYESERRAQVRPLVEGSLAMWAAFAEEDEEKATQRDVQLRADPPPLLGVPPLTQGVLHRDREGNLLGPAGTLGPQGRVSIDGVEGLLDDLVGFGFQLLASEPIDDALTYEQRELLDQLGVNVLTVSADGPVFDLDGTYSGFLRENGATAVLTRPDFSVFGAARGNEELSELVDDLLGQLQLTEHRQSVGAL